MTEIGEIVHHRKAQSTGATITVEKTGKGSWVEQEDGWMTMCLNHGQLCSHDTRALAVSNASEPEGWCGDCYSIFSGTNPKITGPKIR